LSFALAAIALIAIVGGDFSRRGYGRRIAIAAAAGVILRIATVGLQAAATDNPSLNIVQYLLPGGTAVIVLAMFLFGRKRVGRRAKALALAPA
jgi:lipopolysaccharide export system permease protein